MISRIDRKAIPFSKAKEKKTPASKIQAGLGGIDKMRIRTYEVMDSDCSIFANVQGVFITTCTNFLDDVHNPSNVVNNEVIFRDQMYLGIK